MTWFLLSWVVKPFLDFTSFSLRPLWYNPPNDPPWATCDWIRLHEGPGHHLKANYSQRCLKNNKRWLPNMIGAGNQIQIETKEFLPSRDPDESITCFDTAALGLTPFANQGSGHHGWKESDPPPPAFGRAPMLYQFRKHMMRMVHAKDAPKRSLREIVVFFSSKSSHRVSINFSSHAKMIQENIDDLNALVRMVIGHDRLKVVVKHEILFEKSALQQIDLTSNTCVYITAAGGGAFTAQFLPLGSALILYDAIGGKDIHDGKVDWKFFNAASWMRPTFVDISQGRNHSKLLTLVKSEILNCLEFMEILDV